MFVRSPLLALLALLLMALPAAAHDYKLGALEIGQPWARATPPTAPTGGGYLSVKNTGTTPDRLMSASSPAAGAVQVHEMKMDGNVMRMRELDGPLEIKPGETVTLAPGGMHLMMIGLYLRLNLAVLWIVARSSAESGWRLTLMLFVLGFVTGSLNSLIEALFFQVLTFRELVAAALAAAVIFAILSPLAVLFAVRWRVAAEAPMEYGGFTPLTLLAAVLSYEMLYWTAGLMVSRTSSISMPATSFRQATRSRRSRWCDRSYSSERPIRCCGVECVARRWCWRSFIRSSRASRRCCPTIHTCRPTSAFTTG